MSRGQSSSPVLLDSTSVSLDTKWPPRDVIPNPRVRAPPQQRQDEVRVGGPQSCPRPSLSLPRQPCCPASARPLPCASWQPPPCQPVLSFPQSHLFGDSHPQHSALDPQTSPQRLARCLGAFAAAAMMGSPDQLTGGRPGTSGPGQPRTEGLLPGPSHVHTVSHVCRDRDLRAPPQQQTGTNAQEPGAGCPLPDAHGCLLELHAAPSPGT